MRVLSRRTTYVGWLPSRACVAAGCLALGLGGCGSGISTPLPDLPPSHTSTAMTLKDRQKAVTDLEQAGATHEEAAERQIEQSR
jgi:hypothetical protein